MSVEAFKACKALPPSTIPFPVIAQYGQFVATLNATTEHETRLYLYDGMPYSATFKGTIGVTPTQFNTHKGWHANHLESPTIRAGLFNLDINSGHRRAVIKVETARPGLCEVVKGMEVTYCEAANKWHGPFHKATVEAVECNPDDGDSPSLILKVKHRANPVRAQVCECHGNSGVPVPAVAVVNDWVIGKK